MEDNAVSPVIQSMLKIISTLKRLINSIQLTHAQTVGWLIFYSLSDKVNKRI